MSMILKGIDLPHEEINLTITKDGRIYLNNKYHLIAEAIQISKDHGRIGDLDELKKSIEEVDRPDGYTALVHIKYAPTILEAEE